MNFWKKCSSCKKEIPFESIYQICSVSTCQHKRKGFQFCSVQCWDSHLGFANHREAWALEKKSPTKSEFRSFSETESLSSSSSSTRAAKRTIIDNLNNTSPTSPNSQAKKASSIKTDTLVVVSKVKKLIKDQSGFNTSQCCIDALTKKVIEEVLKAIEESRKLERKTVMGRDVK